MFWSDLVFGQKQGGNYEKPSRVSRLAAGAADARLLRPRPRATCTTNESTRGKRQQS